MPLINCKVELKLIWREKCILSSAETAVILKITDKKLYFLVVAPLKEDNMKLAKQ